MDPMDDHVSFEKEQELLRVACEKKYVEYEQDWIARGKMYCETLPMLSRQNVVFLWKDFHGLWLAEWITAGTCFAMLFENTMISWRE